MLNNLFNYSERNTKHLEIINEDASISTDPRWSVQFILPPLETDDEWENEDINEITVTARSASEAVRYAQQYLRVLRVNYDDPRYVEAEIVSVTKI